MYSVVRVTVKSITDHCPFYKVGDTFFIKQQCLDPALATPKQFCMHSLTDIYTTYREVRKGPVGNRKSKGCMDHEKALFELERLPDEEGRGWN
jgi:uncharacterized repeat protein (TIGR04076 family)